MDKRDRSSSMVWIDFLTEDGVYGQDGNESDGSHSAREFEELGSRKKNSIRSAEGDGLSDEEEARISWFYKKLRKESTAISLKSSKCTKNEKEP